MSLVLSLADSDGWHELDVAVLEPVYAAVRARAIALAFECCFFKNAFRLLNPT